jgi:hypothetical protein
MSIHTLIKQRRKSIALRSHRNNRRYDNDCLSPPKSPNSGGLPAVIHPKVAGLGGLKNIDNQEYQIDLCDGELGFQAKNVPLFF